jgi:hypothetical protein
MLLSFEQEGIKSESSQNYMEPGLDIPAKLIYVGYGKDKEGKPSKELNFEFDGTSKENAGKFTYIPWLSTFDRNGEYNKSKNDEEFQKQVNRELSKIFHILTAYAPEEQVKGLLAKSNNKIEKAFELIIEAMNSFDFKDVPVELMITLDKKGRTQFRTFPNFIRSANTPGRTFRVDNKINKYTGLPNDIMSRDQLPQKPAQGSNSGFGNNGGGFGSGFGSSESTESSSEQQENAGGFGFGAGQKNPF